MKMEGPSLRIIRQVKRMLNQPIDGIVFEPNPANFRHFLIELIGPPESCYQGGKYQLELLLPEAYPMLPPKVVFNTKIYHPYIDVLGRICLEILYQKWSPVIQIKIVLTNIRNLLCHPDQEGTYNYEAAQHWRKNKKDAQCRAREITLKYAH